MKLFLTTLGILTVCLAFGQDNQLSWYKMISGKIDKYPVTMHLHKAGHIYSGYYYYDSQQRLVYFTGEDTSVKGKIALFGFSDDNEYFEFSFMGTSLLGSWKKAEGKALAFSGSETKAPISFGYVFTQGITKLRPRMKESPEGSFSSEAVWPLGTGPQEEAIKKVIRRQVDEGYYGTEDIGPIFLKAKKEFLSSYIEDNKDTKDSDITQFGPYSYNQELTQAVRVAYLSPTILSLASFTYTYTGGAHGNYGTSFSVFDLANNRELSLSDIITADGKKALGDLLEKNFRKQYGLKPTDSLQEGGLFENHIKPTDNFYLTGKGIGFSYVPYEIGPYAMGEVLILIPFKDLAAYLKPRFK